MTREALLEEALKLPAKERAAVASELLASLDNQPQDDLLEVEQAWAVEIERRARRALAGESEAVPWEEVRERIAARLSSQ